MLKKILLIISLFILTTSISAAHELGTNCDLTLSGTLIIRVFTDANDDPEKALVLVLDKPIDVKKDDMGGPAKNTREVQLAIMNKATRAVAKEYINKKVIASGLLYYGHTAHHHTKVLMAANQLDKLN